MASTVVGEELGIDPDEIRVLHADSLSALPSNSPVGSRMAIMLGGVVTAIPLLLFAIAARRMDYSALGFIQFIAPTIVFLLGISVFGEQLLPIQLASFLLIWTALAIFVWDLLSRRNRQAKLSA